ncbi:MULTISPECIES: hypothetical protein [unclassified Ensifer]|uniref:hypothetical protein n=1 Tax=unclassified Ensifer TaxID=2633371 RepID=UPI000812C727|nr:MULTISPECIES: hypothetical protein [unclassified Ensifer]OCP03083.1 hypothetical protein BC362_18090 [Ensifer sp. LC14]OCP08154.1 hypothetical protein BBX50_20425 [Ensifer sp. LC11]OCP08825.1 hypothetical protein BC374_20615 [Ensifer sp. LC13]OCP32194.1 hypothetical protein BC364_19900 [Ensifer sp. LC499]
MSAVAYALASIPVAMLLALMLKRLRIEESTTFIALLLLPLGVWGIASGTISEFSAGGVALKFREAAKSEVKLLPLTDVVEDFQSIEKEGVSAIERLTRTLTPGRPVALVLNLGRPGYYAPAAVILYLQALSSVDPELTLVVTDREGKFAAAADGRAVINFLTGQDANEAQRRFREALDAPDAGKLLQLPGFTNEAIAAEATNAEALTKMDQLARRTLVALDTEGRPKGLAKRDAIVTHLLVQLTSDTAKAP